jgi:hypothetical protein
LWAFGRNDLKLNTYWEDEKLGKMDEFWTMHPLQFNTLSERHYRSIAEGRAFLANALGCQKEDKSQYTSDDFMPKPEEVEDDGWGALCGQMKGLAARWGALKET